jgi:hypothetical protein
MVGQTGRDGVYVGRRNLRGYGGHVYVHIPASLASLNGLSRRVVVTATLNSRGCGQVGDRLDGSTFRFTGYLAPAGGSYRISFPQDYSKALVELVGCASVDLWLEPVPEAQAQPPAPASNLKPATPKPQPKSTPAEAPKPLIPQQPQPRLKPLEAAKARVEERLEGIEGSEDYLVDLGRPGSLSRLSRILGLKAKRW